MQNINNTLLKNDIENKVQVFIKFKDDEYKMFNLYAQDEYFIERIEEKEILNVVTCDNNCFTYEYNEYKLKSEKISSKISNLQYEEILNLKEISNRKFNTDRLELKSNLTFNDFLNKYFN